MAVYTEVGVDEADALFQRLGLGAVSAMQGIASGIENTNYFVTTPRGEWVLTLFERLDAGQLPYYLRLMQHLARHAIPVPAPQEAAGGELLHQVAGKPAAVVTRLAGTPCLAPDIHHCEQVGHMLARMHHAGSDFALSQPHLRGLDWWRQTAPALLPHLGTGQAALLREELLFQQHFAASPTALALPRGPIHADLFRDNALFDDRATGHELSGFFDFYFAGTDALLFDLAVCLNDWCTDLDSGALCEPRAAAFTSAYQRERAMTPGELRALPAMLRAAALRFWISRLWDWHLPRDAALLQAKDPTHFERVLRARIQQPWHAA